jgi:sugar phosphate isomerase/epimerase
MRWPHEGVFTFLSYLSFLSFASCKGRQQDNSRLATYETKNVRRANRQEIRALLKLRKAVRLQSFGLPFRAALESAARIGAEGIEINARTEVLPHELTRTGVRQIRKMLDDFRLKVACIWMPTRRGYANSDELDRRLDATRAAMSMAYDLGCDVVSNHIGEIPEEESPERIVLTQAMEDLGRHGQRVGAFFAARTGDNPAESLAGLIGSLGPGALHVDFDPAELAISGHAVMTSVEQLAPHVVHFRARDYVRDLSRREMLNEQLGRGTLDLAGVLSVLEAQDYRGFITVQRQPGPSTARILAEELEYLTNVFEG